MRAAGCSGSSRLGAALVHDSGTAPQAASGRLLRVRRASRRDQRALVLVDHQRRQRSRHAGRRRAQLRPARDGKRFLLKDAVDQAGDLLLGADVMRARRAGTCSASSSTTWDRSRITCTRATSTPGRWAAAASPRPTTFRRSTTRPTTTSRTRSWASSRARRKTTCAAASRTGTEGDNGILYLSRAYRLEVGTGWQIDPGILHAPGSLRDLRAAGQQRRVRDVPVGSRRADHRLEPARQGRAAGAAPRSRLHHRHARLGRQRQPAIRREQPLLPEAGEAVCGNRSGRVPRAVGVLRHRAGIRRRSSPCCRSAP